MTPRKTSDRASIAGKVSGVEITRQLLKRVFSHYFCVMFFRVCHCRHVLTELMTGKLMRIVFDQNPFLMSFVAPANFNLDYVVRVVASGRWKNEWPGSSD